MLYELIIASAIVLTAPAQEGYHTAGYYDNLLTITPRVLDRSIVKDIERVQPYVAPNGAVYEKEAQERKRIANFKSVEQICRYRLEGEGKPTAECLMHRVTGTDR